MILTVVVLLRVSLHSVAFWEKLDQKLVPKYCFLYGGTFERDHFKGYVWKPF